MWNQHSFSYRPSKFHTASLLPLSPGQTCFNTVWNPLHRTQCAFWVCLSLRRLTSEVLLSELRTSNIKDCEDSVGQLF